jgi:hypothetical protein
MTYAKMPSITVTAPFLSHLLPVMTVLFLRIRGRVLLFRARILPGLVIAWLRLMFYGEVFGYHLKGLGRRLHGMWFVGK